MSGVLLRPKTLIVAALCVSLLSVTLPAEASHRETKHYVGPAPVGYDNFNCDNELGRGTQNTLGALGVHVPDEAIDPLPQNVGGACFEVPGGATSVTITVVDLTGLRVAAYAWFVTIDDGGNFGCVDGTYDVPSRAEVMHVALQAPMAGDLCPGLDRFSGMPTSGTISVLWS